MRIAHTMIRIADLDKSIDFYTRLLGMKEFRRMDFPDGKFTLVFLGYGDESKDHAIELTYNWDEQQYDLGTGYGHVAIQVADIHKTCTDIKTGGGSVVREPGPMKHGTTVIAFVEDPDGYKIELIQHS